MPAIVKRLWSAGGALLARDTAVVTNAIAFNFLLCLFPLMLVAVAAAQRLPGFGRGGEALLLVLHELIPFEREALARSLQGMGRFAHGLEAASLLLIVWGSSGIFMPVEMALNRAWGGQPRAFLRSRMLAFAMTTGCGLLAMLSVGLTVAARAYREDWPRLAEYGAKASALLLTYLLFFVIYRIAADPAPPTRVALRAALWGGTAWELAKYAFVVNLARTNLRIVYGPLAFAVALVLWAYLSSLVLVFGALMSPAPGPARRRGRRRTG